MADAVYRQWLLLRRIPREPRRCSTRELWEKLRGEAQDVTKRTVERDLISLSAQFGFTSEVESNTTYWFWPADAAALDVPGLDPAGALALVLASEHLQPLLPASVLDAIAPYLRRAEQVLDAETGKRLGAWRNKVRTVQRGPVLLKPKIDPAIHAVITDALLRERRLRAHYRSRQAEDSKEHVLNPLGLVAKEGVLYLIATAWKFDTPLQYALHRFLSAEVLEASAVKPSGFTLDAYINEHAAFSYPESSRTMRLVVDFDSDAITHLRERPLSTNQALASQPGGRVRLTATVAETRELHWWLSGFGENVEVIEPLSLRAEFRRINKRLYQRYSRRGGQTRNDK